MLKNYAGRAGLLSLVIALCLFLVPSITFAKEEPKNPTPHKGETVEVVASQTKSLTKKGEIGTMAIGIYGDASSVLKKYSGGAFVNPGGSGLSETKLYPAYMNNTAYVDASFYRNYTFIAGDDYQARGQAFWSSGRYDGLNTHWQQSAYHEVRDSNGFFMASENTNVEANF